jgi:Arc/MetJ-type ribon-helix-helix transcriptional regulator
MTAAKIAITLPREQLAHVQRAVKRGAASSVSGYITRVLSEEHRRESLRALLDELLAQHGAPTPKEVAWARNALSRRRRA